MDIQSALEKWLDNASFGIEVIKLQNILDLPDKRIIG